MAQFYPGTPAADPDDDFVSAPDGLYVEFLTEDSGETIAVRLVGWVIDENGRGDEIVACPWEPWVSVVVTARIADVRERFGWDVATRPRPLWRKCDGDLFWGDLDPEHGPDVGEPYTSDVEPQLEPIVGRIAGTA